MTGAAPWPELSAADDHGTLRILHLASQMLGKVRVAHAPWSNHGWHAALQPAANGFSTLPTGTPDGRSFTLVLDLCEHVIALRVSDGVHDRVSLELGCVAEIHAELIAMLERHGLPSTFSSKPSEMPDALLFRADRAPSGYSRGSARRILEAFAQVIPVLEQYRAGFSGKSSPVHLWWGAFDLAVSRFSGRPAPPHPGGMPGLPDRVTREAYSHEVASAGFWLGGAAPAEPFFYSYIYPEPQGYRAGVLKDARFDEGFGEFMLPYREIQASAEPGARLAGFLQSTYALGADLAGWDRQTLERDPTTP